ncbi:uncharacterized protein LOC143956879 [Lithobates pipiens]
MSKTEDLEMESDEMMKKETHDNGTPAPKNTQYWVVLILVIIIMFMFLILVFFTILQFIQYGNLTEEQTLLMNDVSNLSSLLEHIEKIVADLTLRQDDLIYQQEILSTKQSRVSFKLERLDSELELERNITDRLSTDLENVKQGTRPLSNDIQRISGAVGKLADGIQKAHGPSTPLCETHWVHYGLSCYYKSWKAESWEDARKDCKYNMSDLVVINGEDEMNFLYHFSEQEVTWIGLAEERGIWKWVDDTSYEMTPTHWQYGGPYPWPASDLKKKDECAYLLKEHSWSHDKCSHKFMYICENKRILL